MNSAVYNSKQNLDYYIHDEPRVLRFEIAGDWVGAGVKNLAHALHTAKSVLEDRRIVVGLTSFAEADDDGMTLLLNLHRSDATIVARSTDSRTLAESILGSPIQMLPFKSGRRQRIGDFLRRWSAAALIMAFAEKRHRRLSTVHDK